jgi:hypothetical protein
MDKRWLLMCNMKAPIIKYHTGAMEGEKVLRLSALYKQPDAEIVRDLMIAYVTGFHLQADWPSYGERLSALIALAVPCSFCTLLVVRRKRRYLSHCKPQE